MDAIARRVDLGPWMIPGPSHFLCRLVTEPGNSAPIYQNVAPRYEPRGGLTKELSECGDLIGRRIASQRRILERECCITRPPAPCFPLSHGSIHDTRRN